MTTTLLNCQVLLSKELADYYEGTTTGSSSAVTIVDTGLIAYPNDWITDGAWDLITSGSLNGEERKISTASLLTAGSLTVGTHSGSVASGVFYQVHRLFTPSEKRRALVAAASNIFGVCYDLVWNEEIVSGNWLKDGSFEIWANGTSLSNWSASAIVPVQCSTSAYFKHGVYSALLTGTIGTLSQGITQFGDLKYLSGKNAALSVQANCNTGSCLRLAISDGSTTTYSSYHAGTNWTENTQPLEVQAYLASKPSEVTFKICHDIAGGTSYVDDARVISGYRNKLYIGHLGLAKNQPNQIFIEPTQYSQEEPWLEIHDWTVDEDGYLHLPTSVSNDYRLRIIGKQYLDFLTSGTSSTAWTATINLDYPQTEILAAEAAVYLYTWMSMPNYESGTREDYQGMIGFWKDEAKRRKGRFGMTPLPITVSWGHE